MPALPFPSASSVDPALSVRFPDTAIRQIPFASVQVMTSEAATVNELYCFSDPVSRFALPAEE